ncbi:MAG: hypothetical protein K8R40_00005, partial [Anaerolineaceae bacterium]|nr:hypothetical protein [Anaerolineaceae bacterium]
TLGGVDPHLHREASGVAPIQGIIVRDVNFVVTVEIHCPIDNACGGCRAGPAGASPIVVTVKVLKSGRCPDLVQLPVGDRTVEAVLYTPCRGSLHPGGVDTGGTHPNHGAKKNQNHQDLPDSGQLNAKNCFVPFGVGKQRVSEHYAS